MDKSGTSGMKRATTSASKSVPPNKKTYQTRPQNKDHEEILAEWLNESSESDCDNIDPTFVALESDHNSTSEQEGSESEETISEPVCKECL